MSNEIKLRDLNIASEPFRNRTLPWLVALVVALISLVALVYVVGQSRALTARAKADEVEVERLKKKEQELRSIVTQADRNLPADQRQLLLASHQLVDRKYFSWSWLFEDLESVLPSEAKVTRINVRDVKQIDGRMVADLDLAILSKNYVDITGMLAAMDRSGVFQSEVTEQNAQKAEKKDQTEWTLHIIYHQRSGRPSSPVADATHPDTVAAVDPAIGGRR